MRIGCIDFFSKRDTEEILLFSRWLSLAEEPNLSFPHCVFGCCVTPNKRGLVSAVLGPYQHAPSELFEAANLQAQSPLLG